MKLRQDKPATNPSIRPRAGAANNETKDWLAQMAQNFRPLAQNIPYGISITAGQINPRQNYAIVIRIGDAHLSKEPEKTRSYVTQQVDAIVRDIVKEEEISYLDGTCDRRASLLVTAGIGFACGIGVYLTSGSPNLIHAMMGVLTGCAAITIYEAFVGNRQLNKATKTAREILRQFRPHGPPPAEPERYFADPNSGTAIIYRKL